MNDLQSDALQSDALHTSPQRSTSLVASTPFTERRSPAKRAQLSAYFGTPLAALLFALLSFAACGDEHAHHGDEAEGHHGTSANGDHGVFKFAYSNEASEWKVGSNVLLLEVKTIDGEAVEGASLELEPFMPGHGHGSIETPKVSEVGEGSYRIEDVVFQMPGEWTLHFEAKKGELHDEVTFVLEVK